MCHFQAYGFRGFTLYSFLFTLYPFLFTLYLWDIQNTVHTRFPYNRHALVFINDDKLHLNALACEIGDIDYGCPLVIACIKASEGFALLPVAEFFNASA